MDVFAQSIWVAPLNFSISEPQIFSQNPAEFSEQELAVRVKLSNLLRNGAKKAGLAPQMKDCELGHADILQILIVDKQLLQNILTCDLPMLYNEVQKRIKVDPHQGPAPEPVALFLQEQLLT